MRPRFIAFAAYTRAELALKLEPLLRAKAKEKQKEAGGAVPQKSVKAPLDTQKELARVAHVSHDTIAKAKVIAEKASEETKAALLLPRSTQAATLAGMTRHEIAHAARERAVAILARLAEHPEAVRTIPLSNYPSAADYRALCGPDAGWSFRGWQAVNEAVVERLREAGVVVVLVELRADDVLAWLHEHGLANTAPNRAQYVSAKTTGFRATPLPDAAP